MKRSEINFIIKEAADFFKRNNFHLPPWAFWGSGDWKGKYTSCSEIIDNQLGWDITDFGSDNFWKNGLVLFTIRNGSLKLHGKKYCEKIMIVREEQVTPMHFHWTKTEDIINRGGGNLVLELYMADKNNKLTNDAFTIKTDGIEQRVASGYKLILHPGESITFEPYISHRFYGEKGKGTVLVGEVSSVNDDASDNCFIDDIGRFPAIEEDEAPIHLLVSDYNNYL